MLIKIHPENPQERLLEKAIKIFQSGGVIICPTDTVYAFCCDINNPKAVERVARLKEIEIEKANFSFVCYDLSHLSDYTKPIHNNVFKLMKKCLPGPYTFILEANSNVPKIFKSKKKHVGIRVPDNHIIRELVNKLGNPLMATSVHDDDEIMEYITDPELIYEKYKNNVDAVIDGGIGKLEGSTVIECINGDVKLIREGLGLTVGLL